MSAGRRSKRSSARPFPVVNGHAAGIDVGSRFHVVAVSPDSDDEPVRTFGTFTGDLHRLADWLASAGVTTVAMESTSVYWIPLFEILESRGFAVILANAREAKNVPGRKTDVNDAQWLQRLHCFGLLRASFRPHERMLALRAYLRQRERHVEYAASHVQHMQKALDQMNVQLHHAVTDITGATGMRILRAILGGERDPAALATLRDVRCKSDAATIRAALAGNFRPEHVFSLRQAFELYEAYQLRIGECDDAIERELTALSEACEPPSVPLPESRTAPQPSRGLPFDARPALHVIAGGADLTQIHGLGAQSVLQLIGECGTDMTRWATGKHFSSWLGLSPGNKISGGKVLRSRTRRTTSRAASVLRLAAVRVGKTQTALGAFFRRIAARAGKAKAVTATARKLAVLVYNALRHGLAYVDPGIDHYEQRYRQRVLDSLRRRAEAFGFSLVKAEPEGGVS